MIPTPTIWQVKTRAEQALAAEDERRVQAHVEARRRVLNARLERDRRRRDLYEQRARIDAELRTLRAHAPGDDPNIARAVAYELWCDGPEYAHTQALYEHLTPDPPHVTAERRRALRDAYSKETTK